MMAAPVSVCEAAGLPSEADSGPERGYAGGVTDRRTSPPPTLSGSGKLPSLQLSTLSSSFVAVRLAGRISAVLCSTSSPLSKTWAPWGVQIVTERAPHLSRVSYFPSDFRPLVVTVPRRPGWCCPAGPTGSEKRLSRSARSSAASRLVDVGAFVIGRVERCSAVARAVLLVRLVGVLARVALALLLVELRRRQRTDADPTRSLAIQRRLAVVLGLPGLRHSERCHRQQAQERSLATREPSQRSSGLLCQSIAAPSALS